MVGNVVNAISKRIYENFGDEYKIYSNKDIKQGLEEPCFFIDLLTHLQEKLFGNRYLKRLPFDILYFPENEGNNAEMRRVGEMLFDVLEYITLSNGDLLRGMDTSYQITDGILRFSVSYQMHVRKETESVPAMEEAQIKQGTQTGGEQLG